jgi:hypothetical protein
VTIEQISIDSIVVDIYFCVQIDDHAREFWWSSDSLMLGVVLLDMCR